MNQKQPIFVIPIGADKRPEKIYDRGDLTDKQLSMIQKIVAGEHFVHASISDITNRGGHKPSPINFIWHDDGYRMHTAIISVGGTVTKHVVIVTPDAMVKQAGDNFWMVGRSFFIVNKGIPVDVKVGPNEHPDPRFPDTMKLMNRPENMQLYADEMNRFYEAYGMTNRATVA